MVAAMMNARSAPHRDRIRDQAIFVRKVAFERIGRFPEIALMEDVALSRALKRISQPLCLRPKVTTSAGDGKKKRRPAHDPADVRLRLLIFSARPGRACERYAMLGE
jgi:hypothetical protein